MRCPSIPYCEFLYIQTIDLVFRPFPMLVRFGIGTQYNSRASISTSKRTLRSRRTGCALWQPATMDGLPGRDHITDSRSCLLLAFLELVSHTQPSGHSACEKRTPMHCESVGLEHSRKVQIFISFLKLSSWERNQENPLNSTIKFYKVHENTKASTKVKIKFVLKFHPNV